MTNIPISTGSISPSDLLLILEDHVHSEQKVYPTLANGTSLSTHSDPWTLGTITEIVPADVITEEFDIHGVCVEDVSRKDETYEIVLYYGLEDVECGRLRFSSDTDKGGIHTEQMQTPRLPPNSRIRGRLAIEGGNGETAELSLRYHTYEGA